MYSVYVLVTLWWGGRGSSSCLAHLRRGMSDTAIADRPNEIEIGAFKVTLVPPNMVRIYDEEECTGLTMYEWEVADVLRMVQDTRR